MGNIFPGFEVNFNTVAKGYDRMRPGYVEELYRDLFAVCPMGEGKRALEIGIGTGQATPPVLATGCQVTAVELGDQLSAYTAQKFASYPNFSVHNLRFEDFSAPAGSFDLIYSASAFHWIPEEIGYRKVFELLKPGGVFARFANHPHRDLGRPALHDAMQKWYALYMPRSKPAPQPYAMEQARARAEIALRYGFDAVDCRLYHRTRTFTAQEYAALISTYSDHIALGDKQAEFYAHIMEEIDRFGGEITIYDTIDLEWARKPE